MIVVDTSVWISAIRDVDRPSTRRLREETARGQVLLGDFVLLEILRGARDDRHAQTLENYLRPFPKAQMMDGQLAVEAATNYRRLRAVGVTARSLADLIIATFCIDQGHELLHEDRDFGAMAEHLGLRLA
jgi:predicted nucleic acid-binding protein